MDFLKSKTPRVIPTPDIFPYAQKHLPGRGIVWEGVWYHGLSPIYSSILVIPILCSWGKHPCGIFPDAFQMGGGMLFVMEKEARKDKRPHCGGSFQTSSRTTASSTFVYRPKTNWQRPCTSKAALRGHIHMEPNTPPHINSQMTKQRCFFSAGLLAKHTRVQDQWTKSTILWTYSPVFLFGGFYFFLCEESGWFFDLMCTNCDNHHVLVLYTLW